LDDGSWAQRLHDLAVIVAAEDGHDIGLCCVGDDDEAAPGLACSSIWIHPDHRGRGILGDLLATATEVARSARADRLVLWVKPDNERAIAAYATLGFTEIRLEVEPSENAGELRMERPLSR
jgi:ribosomal protein S18 acetylase RimI-like enzyme